MEMERISSDCPAANMCLASCGRHVDREEPRLKPVSSAARHRYTGAPGQAYLKPRFQDIGKAFFIAVKEGNLVKSIVDRYMWLENLLGGRLEARRRMTTRQQQPRVDLEICEVLTRQQNRVDLEICEVFYGDDDDRLHAGCRNGELSVVEGLLKSERNLCFQKDRFGNTPIHLAARKGRVDVIDRFLKYCPESVREVTATEETCLHMAVKYNKTKVVQHLVNWIGERPAFLHLLNSRDYEGNTALHISTSRRQLQTLRVLLSTRSVDVNALNSGCITALDILYVLPYSGKIDMEIDIILREAGAIRAQDLTGQTINRNDDYFRRTLSNRSSNVSNFQSMFSYRSSTLLLMASLLATITYQAAFHLLGNTFQQVYEYSYITSKVPLNKQDSVLSSSFILLNSMVFLASVGMILYLLHEFPLKPWPQISISALFGSYMCLIMAILPNEALPLLFVSIPFLLLAAVGKHVWFAV